MERIEALISQLKEEFEQNADPSRLLTIVQSLYHELAQSNCKKAQNLGTAKVAVVMPASMNMIAEQDPIYEKYAPKPEKPVVHEPGPDGYRDHRVKETVLVDQGSVSVVQKNGQLDMVFDPMTEIPTLSHQPREVNDTIMAESLNDKLREGKTELIEILKDTPVKDLRKAVGINDRFLFINELFRGDEVMYERSIKTINSFNIFPEAEYWINRELKVKLGWSKDNKAVQHFDQLVKRRFS
jgi:hypothetical protein